MMAAMGREEKDRRRALRVKVGGWVKWCGCFFRSSGGKTLRVKIRGGVVVSLRDISAR